MGREGTVEGKTIIGQNVDWLSFYSLYLLKIYHPNGIKELALSLGGMVEYTLNSAGIGICANSLFTSPSNYQFHLPLGCYLPKIMRQSSIQDAVELLKQAARGIGYYHLADNQGNIAGIESTFTDVEVIEPQKGMLFHSNCYLTKRLKTEDLAPVILPDSLVRKERIGISVRATLRAFFTRNGKANFIRS